MSELTLWTQSEENAMSDEACMQICADHRKLRQGSDWKNKHDLWATFGLSGAEFLEVVGNGVFSRGVAL